MLINKFLFEIECKNISAENILWHPQKQAAFWSDTQAKQLHIWHATNKQHEVISLPSRLASFVFTDKDNCLLAAFEQGLALFNYVTGELNWVSMLEQQNTHTRLSKGCCDSKGRYWLGSMIENGDFNKLPVAQQGALYCAHFEELSAGQSLQSTRIEQALSGLQVSSTLCFNHDASHMYHSDSASHKVYQYKLDTNGDILDRSLFCKFEKHCFADGACVDQQGNVWIALLGGACVVCLNAKGDELFRYPLPLTQASSVTIGGLNMDWLFVTSVQYNLSPEQLELQPRAGNVLVYELKQSLGNIEAILKLPSS